MGRAFGESIFFHTGTGQPIVQAGGISQYGTQAAGEFLTNSRSWEPLLRQAPKDWPERNLQAAILESATSLSAHRSPPKEGCV